LGTINKGEKYRLTEDKSGKSRSRPNLKVGAQLNLQIKRLKSNRTENAERTHGTSHGDQRDQGSWQ